MWRVALFMTLVGVASVACNVSDEGGGIDVACTTVADCSDGERCVNNECLPQFDDSGDAGVADSSIPVDMSTDDAGNGGTDAEMEMGTPACPDGFIDFNLDPDDGCETREFPGWQIDSCKACAGLPNAVAGCGGGQTCVIAYCEDGFYDRDGNARTGCEATCQTGECWDMVALEGREFAYLPEPDRWFMSGPSGLVGRRSGGQSEWNYHSLGGPRDLNGSSVEKLLVANDVIYGVQAGRLVRSVDHGRSFGPVPGAPDNSTIDLQRGADDRFYLLTNEKTCAPATCTSNAECADPARPELVTCTATGVCGGAACASDFGCEPHKRCSTDGFCVPRNTGCDVCGNCFGGGMFVFATDDFQTFDQLGPELPRNDSFTFVHGTPTGEVLVSGPSEVYRFSPIVPIWERLSSWRCHFSTFYFLRSGIGLAIGDGCSSEYDPVEGKFDNAERLSGTPIDTLFSSDVVYAVGDGFVAVTDNFGRSWEEVTIEGRGVHIYEDPEGGVVILGSRGERWSSSDRGRSWNLVGDAVGPYPATVDSGQPLSLVGVGQTGGIITPSSNGIAAEWVQIGAQSPPRIEQDQGATLAYLTNGGLFTGLDWQNLLPLAVSNQLVPTSNFPACPGSPCRISLVLRVTDATFDGTSFIAIGTVLLEYRPSSLSGWFPIAALPAVMLSPNGVGWEFWEYGNPTNASQIIASDFGLLTDRGYSSDGRQWATTGTADCGNGPFFRMETGDVVAFGDGRICRTTTGSDWSVETESFWSSINPVPVRSFHASNGSFYTVISTPRGTVVNASIDLVSWNRLGPIWPPGSDIDFGPSGAVSASDGFFAVAP